MIAATREQVRVVVLLAAAERAGLAPLDVQALHSLAFISDVLAPVWGLRPTQGKLLKRRGTPFYPELQRDVDALVGLGVISITDVDHELDGEGQWRLRGRFQLKTEVAQPILGAIRAFDDEALIQDSVVELAQALAALPPSSLDETALEDATYADVLVGPGNVLDFAEWQDRNYSANAANRLGESAPTAVRLSAAERVNLYVRHLAGRIG